jgi:hypothetical protein
MTAPPLPHLALASSAGFEVVASDGVLGVVETPLFPPDLAEPDFLVVRVTSGAETLRPVVSAGLVSQVDTEHRRVSVSGPKGLLARLPEHLPIAR